jgi:hypothetical protein
MNLTLLNFGSTTKYGGCISISALQSLELYAVTIKNGIAFTGGAVYAYDVRRVVIQNSHFENNFATNGGGVAVFESNFVIMRSTTFVRNSAQNIGGAVLIDNTQTVVIDESTISSNSALNFGGGISINSVDFLNINSSAFDINSANLGSAIILSGVTNSHVSKCQFSANKARKGGTIYWIFKSNMNSPTLTNNSFIRNYVKYYGATVATESCVIKPEFLSYIIADYVDVYSLSPLVHLLDFYGQFVSSENGVLVEVTLLPENIHCSFNFEKAKVIGGVVAVVQDGVAQFNHLGAICIPGTLFCSIRLC